MIHLNVDQEKLKRLCMENHVQSLALFGSVTRQTEIPDSDLDLLVEFDEKHIPGLFSFVSFERSLGELFGRKVDLNTPGFLSKHFRQEVIEHAIPIYAG
jgi:predicted nucleotidyltransferase